MLEEEKVEREMERQQVTVADKKIAELVRLVIREEWEGSEAGGGTVVVALKGVMAGIEKVMKAVDCVRLRTLKGVLDVLSPLQCVEFLAGIGMLQILLRQWGKKRGNGEATNDCSRQEDGGVGKVGGSSEEWEEVRQVEGLVQVALKGVMAGL
ncbi:hypothetical protein GH714_013903 [Hevea brasiliensis]|uniref:DOG1 domain-containing protein n=1 Tax=Hevea brasiliensis TaxID=3981 RepID=A0A6A6LST0_HEVBR|nr:hypothetical protein GH714_013903 [Hevea brasiliensis]